jgi:hypothetical protein
MEDWNVRMIRVAAWERAKAEMQIMINTYGATDKQRFEDDTRFKDFSALVSEFTREVEDNALQE